MRGPFYTLLFLASAGWLITPFFAAAAPPAGGCPTLTIGATGSPVTALQTFLHKAYTDFPSPTGKFGPLTQAAVKQWQSEHGIEKTGMLGPKTRAAMGLACAPTASTTVTKPTTSSSTAALIQSLLAQVKILQAKLAALLASSTTVSATTTDFVISYAWQTSPWSPCANSSQSRTASCVSSGNASALESYCTASKPALTQSCTVSSVPPQCTPLAAQTQQVACPAGQTGSITQSRTSSCPGPAWSAWTNTANTCTTPPSLTQSCALGGLTIAHGASQTYYSARSVAYGSLCSAISQSRTCTNGSFSGNAGYQYANCSPAAPASCAWNGSTIAHGASVTANLTSTVSYGQLCQTQTRTCSNGTLSGSYTFASCSPGAPSACLLDGVTVNHDSSYTFYSARTVLHAQNCSSVAQPRSCSNGVFSGNASYQYASCTVQAPACIPDPASPQTQTLSCPVGQTGSITQTRVSSCTPGASSPTWGAWTTTANTCVDAPTSLSIRMWDYFMGNPNLRMCAEYDHNFCWSQKETSPGRISNVRTDTLLQVYSENTLQHMFGVFKDSQHNQATPWARCFSDISGSCTPGTPAGSIDSNPTLPIVKASDLDIHKVTPVGVDFARLRTFYSNKINPNTCEVASVGDAGVTSNRGFIVDSYDFGGNLGVQKNVFVIEGVGGTPTGATDPFKGMRFERYFVARGYGAVIEEGYEDTACVNNPTPASCQGSYSTPSPGRTPWNYISQGAPLDTVFEYCAPGAIGSLVTGSSIPTTMIAGLTYPVNINMKNTGAAVWKASSGYKLGSQNPQDNTMWGSNRISLLESDSIHPGQTKAFSFTVTAPAPGSYRMVWHMLQDTVGWFGDDAAASVTVVPLSIGNIFLEVLHREPGSGEVAFWLDALNQGWTYEQIRAYLIAHPS